MNSDRGLLTIDLWLLRCLFLRLFIDDDSGKLDDARRRIFSILTQGRFKDQFPRSDFGEGHIGVAESGNKFHHGPMPQTKLSNASGNHVHQDLLIGNNFRRGLNETSFHNFG